MSDDPLKDVFSFEYLLNDFLDEGANNLLDSVAGMTENDEEANRMAQQMVDAFQKLVNETNWTERREAVQAMRSDRYNPFDDD